MHPHNIMPVPTVPSFVFRAKDWSVITGSSIASSSTWLRRDSSNRRLSSWCINYGHFISALEVRWQTSYPTVTSGKVLSYNFSMIKTSCGNFPIFQPKFHTLEDFFQNFGYIFLILHPTLPSMKKRRCDRSRHWGFYFNISHFWNIKTACRRLMENTSHPVQDNPRKPWIDLFSLYILFSHFRPRDALMGIFLLFFH